jgi:hypothetical protein
VIERPQQGAAAEWYAVECVNERQNDLSGAAVQVCEQEVEESEVDLDPDTMMPIVKGA